MGDEDHELQIYIGKRYFGYEARDWDALPWQIQRAYIEGLKREGILKDGPGDDEEFHAPQQPQESGTREWKTANTMVAFDPFADDDFFRSMGITVVG